MWTRDHTGWAFPPCSLGEPDAPYLVSNAQTLTSGKQATRCPPTKLFATAARAERNPRQFSLKPNVHFLKPECVGILRSQLGEDVIINHSIAFRTETLAQSGLVDAVIVDTEDGFSQLGGMRQFLATDLGFQERNLVKWVLDGFPEKLERNIASLADWNRSRDPEVTLVAIPSERQDGHIKGIILSPYDGSECYKRFSSPEYWLTHRDFMYNVTYEAISYAYRAWNARRIGLTHLSRSKYGGKHRWDVTTCQVEAIAHFCSENEGIESFTFIDDIEGNSPLTIVQGFNALRDIGVHRPIQTKELEFWGLTFVDLTWTKLS